MIIKIRETFTKIRISRIKCSLGTREFVYVSHRVSWRRRIFVKASMYYVANVHSYLPFSKFMKEALKFRLKFIIKFIKIKSDNIYV